MKSPAAYLLFLFLSGLLFSCQKEIDIDLNSSGPRIVIEGEISDHPRSARVKITKTLDFKDPNNFPPVSGAEVKIWDDQGESKVLSEISPGTYYTNVLTGVPGRTYFLEVIAEGKKYTSECKMPEPVSIDSLSVVRSLFGKERMINVYFKDSAGIPNYYRIKETINAKVRTNISILEDRFQDGAEIEYPLFSFGKDSLTAGDTIGVFLQAIDKSVYEYFRTLSLISGDRRPTDAPANPLSNITGGALGYFNACAVRSQMVIIQ